MLRFRQKSHRAVGDRLTLVLTELDLIINEQRMIDKSRDLDAEYDYIREAAHWARVLALRRKMDPDLAAVACALQNVGRILTGVHEGHAQAGYEPAKQILGRLGAFSPAEIEQVATAVRNHSRKDLKQNPLDEIVKDVDIYVRYLAGFQFTRPEDISRLEGLKALMLSRR